MGAVFISALKYFLETRRIVKIGQDLSNIPASVSAGGC